MSDEARFAVLGTGFWSRYQLAAWRECRGASCVAVYNRTAGEGRGAGDEFGIPAVYDDAGGAARQKERPDFVDIITARRIAPATSSAWSAAHGLPVICQKPMAPRWPSRGARWSSGLRGGGRAVLRPRELALADADPRAARRTRRGRHRHALPRAHRLSPASPCSTTSRS